jgi:hypothetical protein
VSTCPATVPNNAVNRNTRRLEDTGKIAGSGNVNCSGKYVEGTESRDFRALMTIKEFLILYGKQMFITTSTSARYCFAA